MNKKGWHIESLTKEHDKHTDIKCYCKNCSCYYWGEETIPVYGAVYCRQCELHHGKSTFEWVHESCLADYKNCGDDECPAYILNWM